MPGVLGPVDGGVLLGPADGGVPLGAANGELVLDPVVDTLL